MMPALTISALTRRRFIMGKQGLYPGRRWRGKEGALQAIRAGCVVQVDPLNVIARSHDITLYGRVLDYQAAHLDALLHVDHLCFDYGGTVMIFPIEELPYWRVTMARKHQQPRWAQFAAEHPQAIETVLNAVRERGPLGTRDLAATSSIQTGSFRSGKDTGQAFYYLWLAGELMTHSRRGGLDRVYDLRERIAPAHLQHAATPEEAEAYFAVRAFREIGLTTLKGWRGWLSSLIERKVETDEAAERMDVLIASGIVTQINVEDDLKAPCYVLTEDVPLLETLRRGQIPDEWQPLETTTSQEMTFLAPLEIVSTRGRAKTLFGFEYLWEVYKPEAKRRWGYYTLPILYGDQLVARFDSKLDRAAKTLVLKGFWLETDVEVETAFLTALTAGFQRFLRFIGADSIEYGTTASIPDVIRSAL